LNIGTKYHTSINISDDIDNILNNINERKPVKVRDYTPGILVQNGIKDLPMYENSSHIRKNILTDIEAQQKGLVLNQKDHYHGLGKDVYIKAIDSLDDPRVIFKNKNSGDYLILTVVKDNNNIVVPIEIETTTTINRVNIDANRIKSVYGYKKQNNIDLNNYIKHNIKNNVFEKIYEQKKERGTGFSTAAGSLHANNISQQDKSVKSDTLPKYSMQENANNTWQEHLEKNYKATGTRTNMQELRGDKLPTYSQNNVILDSNETYKKKILNPTEISKLVTENASAISKLSTAKVTTGDVDSKTLRKKQNVK